MNKSENESNYWVSMWCPLGGVRYFARGRRETYFDGRWRGDSGREFKHCEPIWYDHGIVPNGARRFALDAVLVCICAMA